MLHPRFASMHRFAVTICFVVLICAVAVGVLLLSGRCLTPAQALLVRPVELLTTKGPPELRVVGFVILVGLLAYLPDVAPLSKGNPAWLERSPAVCVKSF